MLINFLQNKKPILFVFSCGILLTSGCSHNANTPLAPPPAVAAPSPREQSPPEAPSSQPRDKIADDKPVVVDTNTALSDDAFNSETLAAIANGKSALFYLLAYSKLGNRELSVLREYVQQIDGNASVDQDEMRDSEFNDYPYTVDSYVIFIHDTQSLQKLRDVAYRYPEIKVVLVPVRKFWVRSYIEIKYSKSFMHSAEEKTIWIGDSKAVSAVHDAENVNLEDPTTHADYLKSCREISTACFQKLMEHGYFQRPTLIDNKFRSAMSFLTSEFATSIDLRTRGYNGQKSLSGKGILNSDYDRAVIDELGLVNEIWFDGKAITGAPSKEISRFLRSGDRPMSYLDDKNNFSFLLPVRVLGADLPESALENENGFLSYLKETQDIFVKYQSLNNH